MRNYTQKTDPDSNNRKLKSGGANKTVHTVESKGERAVKTE